MDLDAKWRQQAACRGLDTKMFFPVSTDISKEVKEICAGCPVKRQCLEFCIENRCSGVWGGTSENQRDRMRKVPGQF